MLKLTYLVLFLTISFCSNAQLRPGFTSDTTEGCSPLYVRFKDQTKGGPTSWKWDLGNGTISYVQNPSTIYTLPGLYTVKLVVSNATGQDSIVQVNYIHVYKNPTVEFSAVPLSGCPPLTVNFTNYSDPGEGTISELVWDFGDGKISSETSPSHVYYGSDTFGVTLTVKNSYGCKSTAYKQDIIEVYSGATANFSYLYENVCSPPTLVTFNNLSKSDVPVSYLWDFGNGVTSTEKNPRYTYTQLGNYSVSLTVTTDQGCIDTVSKSISVGLVNPDFLLPEKTCINEPVSFINSSSPQPTHVSWDFGDGSTATGLNAEHIYTKAGTYEVKMDADFESCNGSITKIITISEKPVSAFGVNGSNASCQIPATISFANQSTNGNSYKWYFGDGDSSTEVSPSHVYSQEGKYSVTLITYTGTGCTDTLVMPDYVQLGPPEIVSINPLPVGGCAPLVINPTAVVNTPEAISSYHWNFGDGTTSNQASPAHQYNNTGVYDVTLTITTTTGCTDSFTLSQAVKVGTHVNPDFSATPRDICASETVTFTDLSVGDVTGWFWYFGDGTTSTQQNPKHQYNDTGYFNVVLYVENNGCADSIVKKSYIRVKPPVAKFSSSFNCTDQYTRSFTDLSIGATSWFWDFGDGTSSTSQNPSHSYTNTGLYNVTLTVTNGSCSDNVVHSVNIVNETPQFSYEPVTDFCKSNPVNFNAFNYNESSVNYFQWVFGDGFTSEAGPSVSHKYTKAGTVSPYLIVGYVDGCLDTIQQGEHYIKLYGPTASFTSPDGVCFNSPVTFTDQSTSDGTHPIVSWIWNFGDSTIQTLSSPPFSHLYTAPGTYPVSLTVQDSYGCRDTIAKTKNVVIAKPVAAFGMLDSTRCVASEATFLNNSQGISLSYLWDFGDGVNSVEQSPVHDYAQEGVYSVKLSITDKFGCTDSIFQQNIVTISNPVASFILNDTFGICPPLLIQPQNTSKNYASVVWNFGDGNTTNIFNPVHYYNIPGQYDITMVVHGHGECYDTAYSSVLLKGPTGVFSYTPLENCVPGQVQFQAVTKHTANYIWDFNNGITKETTDSIVSFSYEHTGNYLPKLIIEDSAGCEVGLTGTDTLRIGSVEAQMSLNAIGNCDSAQFSFSDSSLVDNTNITGYKWVFNGVDSSSSPNPSYYFHKPGANEVKLIVTTDLGCTDTVVRSVNAVIYESPEVNLSAPDSICLNLPVYFKVNDASRQNEISWRWDFGDGVTSNEQNPIHNYLTSDRFFVSVSGTNLEGCSDSMNATLDVLPLPSVSAGSDQTVCLDASVQLQASGANTYVWSPLNGLDCINCPAPVASPDSTTEYFVTGASAFGCVNSDSVVIAVVQPITVSLSATADTLCIGESKQLEVSGAAFYNWTPATGLSDPTIGNPIASPSATTDYTIIGYSDSSGCFTDTTQLRVTVGQLPEFQITDSLVTLNAGSSYPIGLSVSPDVVSMSWTPAYGLSCDNCLQPVAHPTISTTYTATAYTLLGCYVQDQIRIEVICDNSNVYIPNTFSPNNDGHNDYFSVRGTGLFTVKKMQLFNRWGTLVFSKNNLAPSDERSGWDGTYAGQVQQSDVYVYVIEIQCENGTILTYKGNVTLLR